MGFTAHEVRLAQAIGAVLAARFSAILNPRIIAERGDLFRGALEDRYVGAFLDPRGYAIEAREARADRVASIIELLRVAALSSYENRPISTGVLLLGTSEDPCRPGVPLPARAPAYTESLTTIKSFFRLADGVRTVFLANSEGRLLDLIDIERWGNQACRNQILQVPCAKAFQPHARATLQHGHICAVLSPSREIKVFAEGAELFTFRGGELASARSAGEVSALGGSRRRGCARDADFPDRLDLADSREGALFVVARDAQTAGHPAGAASRPARQLACRLPPSGSTPSRRDLLHLLEGRSITDLDPNVLAALASLDGAIVMDRGGRLLAAGAILRHPPTSRIRGRWCVEGARTTAALAASRFGPVLKVSEDGVITFFDGERVWDI